MAHFMGRRIEYVMEVDELESGRRIVLRSIKSPFPMRVTYTFEPDTSGTRATVRVEGGPDGPLRRASGLMSWAVRRNLRKDVARLMQICETGT